MMLEEWRLIDTCPAYEVSDLGRVRRIAPGPGTHVGRIVKQTLTDGYPRVRLCMSNQPVTVCVHVLVLRAFRGPPLQGQEARHLDNVRSNVKLCNLVWGSKADNAADRVAAGSMRGSNHPGAVLSEVTVRAIRKRYRPWSRNDGAKAIALEYGVKEEAIRKAIAGRSWSHVD